MGVTSPGAILLVKWPVTPNISAASVSEQDGQRAKQTMSKKIEI